MARTSGELLAGRYRVLRRLGAGGMATVLLAEDERLGRRVAVKRMHSESPEEVAKRFQREARLGAALNHPNLVGIYDIDTQGDDVLIVMEYVEGGTLKDALSHGPLETDTAVKILTGLAAALDHAHTNGIVHRDVKPANVLIDRDGRAKLADLGIATAAEETSITATGTVLGTASYMAPERLDGSPGDKAVDIYALAAVAYEVLSGHKARTGRSAVEIARQIMNTPPPDIREYVPDAPAPVVDALQRGMAREPGDRPKSAGALVQQIERAYRAEAEDAAEGDETDATAALPAPPPDLASYRAAKEALAGPPPRSTSSGPQSVRPAAADDRPSRPRRRYQPPPPQKRRGMPAGVLGLIVLVVVGIAVGSAISANQDDDGNGGDPPATETTGQNGGGGGGETTGGNTTTPPSNADPADAPDTAVRAFYENAAEDDFDAAWKLAGNGVQQQLGGRGQFEQTFATLESIEFEELKVASRSDIAAVVNIATVATHTDRVDRCTGNVQLTNDGKNGWKLQRLNIGSCDQESPGASGGDPIPEGKGPEGGRPVTGDDEGDG